MPDMEGRDYRKKWKAEIEADCLCSAPAIRQLLDSIAKLETVEVQSVDWKRQVKSELTIRIADGRVARYTFDVLTPSILATYKLDVGGGFWTEATLLLLIEVRRALLALNEEYGLVKFSWDRL